MTCLVQPPWGRKHHVNVQHLLTLPYEYEHTTCQRYPDASPRQECHKIYTI